MKGWTCTIIQNTETGKYRVANFIVNGKDITENFRLPYDFNYKGLITFVRKETGICLLKRKEMIFEQLSDFEKIATLDTTQERIDCRVTIAERKAGWQPCFD